jgi:uncharacterized protein YqjF (DUF2071 family)
MPAVEPVFPAPPHRVESPLNRQTWRDLTFIHWPFPPAAIRPLVPARLELDLWEGMAWVGLVPFWIDRFTHPGLPALPWISRFPETNVRTYVFDSRGLRGIWFFSLDAARLPAVLGARAVYALPYFWAQMRVERDRDTVLYRSRRHFGPPAGAAIDVRFAERIDSPSNLEVFLTARWRLFADRAGTTLETVIEHPPWPLHRASVTRLDETLVRAAGIPQPPPGPLVHFAPRVDVLVSAPKAMRTPH